MNAFAGKENCSTFIGTPQLNSRKPDFRPSTFGQLVWVVASFCISLLFTLCTAHHFCLRSKGNEEGVVVVVIVFEAASGQG